MGIIAQQDGNYSCKMNDIIFFEGENARCLNILLQGKVDVYLAPSSSPSDCGDESICSSSFRLFGIDQNSFIGANALFGEGRYSYSYRASEDSSFYVFIADGQEKLEELFNTRKEYPAYIFTSISSIIEDSYASLLRLEDLIKEFSVSADNLSVYFWMQKEELGFNYAPASSIFRDNLDNLQKLKDKGYSFFPELNPSCFDADYSAIYGKDYAITDGINLDKIEYFSHLSALPMELSKSFFGADNMITSYMCREGAELIEEIRSSLKEGLTALMNTLDMLYSKEKECLFSLYVNAATEISAAGGDVKPIFTILDYIVQKSARFINVIEAEYGYKMNINVNSIFNLLKMQKLKIQSAKMLADKTGSLSVSASSKAEAIPEMLKNSVDKLIEYSDIPKERVDLFRANLEAYRKLKDKFDLDPDIRKIRNSVASVFFEIYEAVFKRSYKEKSDNPLYRMFIDYGYMDEKLLDMEHIIDLYELSTAAPAEHSNVHNMYSWLSKIYSKEKDPSINEFNMDYFDTFRDMRKRGEISDEDKPKYDNNLDGRLNFEIGNMLRTNQRLCHGQLSVYFPILHNEMITKDLKKALVTPQIILDSVNKLLEVDFSAFHREISYYNTKLGIEKEFVMMSVMPDFVLMPVFGTRAVMWQEISGRARNTPGRLLLPTFTSENMDELIVRLVGHFRWELCKTMMGVAWNDISQSSLTADYTDYVQFFRKNKDLSEDAKEKLKAQIQKKRGMLRDIFTSDYEIWVNYESKGNLRLNKVVRKILYKHCPFSKPIREGLEKHPIYSDIASHFKVLRNKHAKDLEIRYTKYIKPGSPLVPELEDNLKFYKEK